MQGANILFPGVNNTAVSAKSYCIEGLDTQKSEGPRSQAVPCIVCGMYVVDRNLRGCSGQAHIALGKVRRPHAEQIPTSAGRVVPVPGLASEKFGAQLEQTGTGARVGPKTAGGFQVTRPIRKKPGGRFFPAVWRAARRRKMPATPVMDNDLDRQIFVSNPDFVTNL